MDLRKTFSGFVVHVTKSAATALTISAGLALWAALRIYAADSELRLPVAVAGGVLVFAALVTAWNSVQQIDERHQKTRLANRSVAAMERDIRQWLNKYHIYSTEAVNKEAGLDFKIEAHDQKDFKFAVVKVSAEPWITILAELNLSEGEIKKLRARAERFQSELVMELSQLGADYELKGGLPPTSVRILTQVMADAALNDLSFLRGVILVRRGLALVAAIATRST